MTLYEFNALNDEDQMQFWMQQGQYLMTQYTERNSLKVKDIPV